jgi:glycosyltransferase involved in cell wall biosynthesis
MEPMPIHSKDIPSPQIVSVVVPVYNSQDSLEELCSRIDRTFAGLDFNYEIILVDDSSKDDSWKVLKQLREEYGGRVKIVQLMRNFGQHNALMCGFHYASGEYVVTMDDDLQNPPEEIPKLIDKIQEGYDCVIGALETKQDSSIKKLGSQMIRYLNTRIFDKPKDLKLSTFRIATKAVTDEIKRMKTPYPYISGMLLSVTRNIANVTVRHDQRKYGQSTYTFKKLIVLAFNLIINYTALPLRALALFGIVISICSFCMGVYFIAKKLLVESIVPGWTSVVVLLSFFNGILLAILSIMGEYFARIIGEVSNRQQYTVREKHL